MTTVLLIVLLLILLGAIPVYPYNRGWGYTPSIGVLLIIVVVLLILF